MNYQVGNIIQCVVTGILKYGIFVKVNKEYTGLIHISEITEYYVKNISDYVNINEKIFARILEIDEDNKQMKLSIKDINYKYNAIGIKEKETRMGFFPLKQNLDKWIKEKIEEYK